MMTWSVPHLSAPAPLIATEWRRADGRHANPFGDGGHQGIEPVMGSAYPC
jgi:hypothetical protein